MKKYILLTSLILMWWFVLAQEFPKFPMTIYGNIKIWSTDLAGWTLKVYNTSNQELASYDITQNGKYWSDNVSITPLLLNEFNWNLTFKVSYNWKTYTVNSIDDSNKWEWCPSKSSITFVSENCRYDIVLKEEKSSNSWWNSSWGHSWGWGWWGSKWWSTNNNTNTYSWTNQNSWSTDKIQNKERNNKETNIIENKKGKGIEDSDRSRAITPKQIILIKETDYDNWNPSEIMNNWFTREMNNAYKFAHDNWITTTNSIEKAKMNSPLTRIQMAKMLSNYAINVLWQQPTKNVVPKFNDISDQLNKQYDNAVTLSYQLGIMGQNMKNNNFRPNDEVTRAEFATALSRMLYWTSDWNPYYVTHIKKLLNEWIITKGEPTIKEKRWYVMIMLMRTTE